MNPSSTQKYTGLTFILAAVFVAMSAFTLSSPRAEASVVTGTLSANAVPAISTVTGVLAADVGSGAGGSSLTGTVSGGVSDTGGSFSGGSSLGGSSFGGSVGGTVGAGGNGAGGTDYLPDASYAYNDGSAANEPGYPDTGGYGYSSGANGGGNAAGTSGDNSSSIAATTSTSTMTELNPTALTAAAADAGLSGNEEEAFLIIGALIILALLTYGISRWIISRREA